MAVHRGERVVAVSPLARRLRARPGMALEAAQARVASLLALPYPPQAEAAWRSLLRELHALTPWVEPQEPGVAFLRLSPEEARLLAQGYRARVGVAPWREVALLAAWSAREGEARVVAEGEEGGFLDRLPLHLLRGVGLTPEGLARLRLLGLGRVGELRAWKPHQVAAYLPEGRVLLPFLYGPWRREVARFPEEAARAILRERLRGPFRSLADFRARLDPPRDLLLALARAGAFDELLPRREALFQAGLPGGGLLPLEAEAPDLPPLGLPERLFLDLETQGLSALPLHPMDLLRSLLEELGATPIPLLEEGPARTAGLVVARQRPPMARGYAFFVLEDGPHCLQAVIPPEVWEEHYAPLRDGEALLVEGLYRGGSLQVERAWPLSLRGLQKPQSP